MPDTEEDLQATADSIVLDSERLTALEEEKRSLQPKDSKRIGLSEAIAALGRRLSQTTAAELALVREAEAEDGQA